ncbi:MAG TPA: hypothetical protein VEV83_18220, partial [Parafilimonas sp.]|nr:hypothetical protein [Parafilimonas sp.]
MKKNVLLCFTALTFLAATTVRGQTLVKNMSGANSDVYAVYKKGNAYYIGGAFTYVGLNTGNAALTKSNNDYPNMDFPRFDGQIFSLIPDGSGGWYAGGYFAHVGGVAKSNLAHINSNNTVDAGFTANTNSTVKTIVKVGTRLYFGGDFTTVNGSPRQYAGAVNSSTGALVAAWNPFPSGSVYSIAAALGADTSFWLGGSFQYVNNPAILRPYLARVNNTNGDFISGSLSANSYTYKITTRGDSIFLGGSFTRLGLKTDYLGSITEGANAASQTMPNANGQIRCIIPDGSGGWYVGGSFSQIGGINKSNVAHINSSKSVDAGFTAAVNGAVYALAKDGTRLYIGGGFSSVNSTPRNYLAAVNASTGAIVAGWDPSANNYVYKLALKDTTVIAVGAFTNIKGYNAYRFAALNKTDGSSIGGFVGYDNQVNSVALGPSDSLLTGGYYTHAGYYSLYSAKVTTSNVKPDPKFPATNGQIYAVVKDGSGNYYVGGSFNQIGGVNQAYIAKLNSNFQLITAWAPQVNGAVRSIILNGSTVYIGGQFTQTNTVTRQYMSALGTANPGANKTWNSSMSSYVYSMVSDGTSIYAGGLFTMVNGSTARNLLAKFDLNGNLDATWNPNATGGGGTVEALAISGTNILAGGSFTTVGGNTRNYLAKLNNTNGSASNWATANSYVYALYVDGTTCYAGGYFTQLTSAGGTMTPRNYLGAIVVGTGNIGMFNPNPSLYVFGITESGTNLYYAGSFTQVNGTERKYLASSSTGGNLQSWNPTANSTARTLVVDGSNIFIGGDFSGFQEVEKQRASIIRYNNQSLANWAPAIDNVVYDITANAT